MKKPIIATLVGTVILFAWQALSWMALPVHKNAFKYSEQQDSIMTALKNAGLEEGYYMLPTAPPSASETEKHEYMEKLEGQPFAMIQYTPGWTSGMGTAMIIGFLLNLLSVAFVVFILRRAGAAFRTFGSRFMVCLGMGIFIILQAHLMNTTWWHTPWHYICGEIIDDIVAWALVGIWLGAYLKHKWVSKNVSA